MSRMEAPNFIVLHSNCPVCGKPLIRNRRGIECGEMHCEYSEDSRIIALESENAALRKAVKAASSLLSEDGMREAGSCFVTLQIFDDAIAKLGKA